MKIKHRHVYRLVILAAVDPENDQLVANIGSFAINQLKQAKGYALVKRSIESNDLFVQPMELREQA
jgi:hypothetical protein